MYIEQINIQDVARKIADHVNTDYAMISVAEHTEIEIPALIKALNELSVLFIGCIFPKVIHDNTILDKGIVINTLKNVEKVNVIENLGNGDYEIPEMIFSTSLHYSTLTYVDGLTENISSYLNRLYEAYGMKTNYFGGGAGRLTLDQAPCLFTKDGFYEDAALLCIMSIKSNIGVKHGWEKLNGPLIVTKADKNTIQEINWKTPFETYKSVIEHHSDKKFEEDNFFDIAKGFPFGIVKNDGEFVIRDPLAKNEKGELVCVGEIEENTLVHIMKGDSESLIEAAKTAAEESIKSARMPRKAMIIDCISRILFLEDQFEIELNSINHVLKSKFPQITTTGALTLGEISSYGNGYLEFFNKTCVVGLFE